MSVARSRGFIYAIRAPIEAHIMPIINEKNIDEMTRFPKRFYILKVGRSKNISTLFYRFRDHDKNWDMAVGEKMRIPRSKMGMNSLNAFPDLCFIINVFQEDGDFPEYKEEKLCNKDEMNVINGIMDDIEQHVATSLGTKTHSHLFRKTFGKKINPTEYYIVDEEKYNDVRDQFQKHYNEKKTFLRLNEGLHLLNGNSYGTYCKVKIGTYEAKQHVLYSLPYVHNKKKIEYIPPKSSVSIKIDSRFFDDSEAKITIDKNSKEDVGQKNCALKKRLSFKKTKYGISKYSKCNDRNNEDNERSDREVNYHSKTECGYFLLFCVILIILNLTK